MVNNENIVRYKIIMRKVKGKNHVSGIVDKSLEITVFTRDGCADKPYLGIAVILRKRCVFERDENFSRKVDKTVFFTFSGKQR